MAGGAAAVALDGGDLPFGAALLALLRPALQALGPGGVLALLSRHGALQGDLERWCRLEHHEYRGCEPLGEGRDRHVIVRGTLAFGRVGAAAEAMPERADPATGFAPRGARVEPGGPVYPFSLLERDHVAPPEIATLYAQAAAAQWSGAIDIPWDRAERLAPALDAALGQIMTFLAENELSALYVPARFLPRIHPAYVEVAMFLATQLADEARHIEVFLERARRAGGLGVSMATTAYSLLTLLELDDFTEAAFLLSVLGEGTFLDLLRFVETHAPDEATAEIMRRARGDESRHVHFGLAHVRHALECDRMLYGRLEAAVRRRAATLAGVGGIPAPLQDSLVILAAGGTEPRALVRGEQALRELLEVMHESRVRRLRSAGFDADQAQTLSDLHTPNFM